MPPGRVFGIARGEYDSAGVVGQGTGQPLGLAGVASRAAPAPPLTPPPRLRIMRNARCVA